MSAKLTLEYDGAGFSGWARQPGLRTIQGEVEGALAQITRREVPVTVAGRTDAGVHALCQIASHDGDPVPVAALNGVLPPDVVVRASEPAEDGFDARRDATSRAYVYRVLAREVPTALERTRALWYPQPVDREALRTMAAALPGRHELTAFTPAETQHTYFARTILHAGWYEVSDGALEFWVEADAFMRHMIRILVGTMLLWARPDRDPAGFATLLDGRPRAEAGPTAPAHALFFAGAGYGAPLLSGEPR